MATINPRSRQLAQVSRAATQPARITQAARPTTSDPALNAWIGAMHEWRHVREGGGNPFEKVLTGRDLVNMGLVTSSQITNPTTPARRDAPGVVISDGQGGSSVIGYEQFAESIKGTRLFHDLQRRIDDPTRFDELHEKTRAALLEELAPIDGKIRGEIRRVEEIATSAKESLAQEVTTIRASIARASAGVRQVRAASANENRATAAQVTTVTARLDNFDGGGATVEETMTAIADRATGLEARYVLKVTAGGAMAGFGLASTDNGSGNATSAFIIQADKFAIVDSSYAGGLDTTPDVSKIPFGIDGTGIYLTGAVRVDGGIIVSGSLDYADVGGTKPPSNADKTSTAIQSTVTITGGGITMSSGGSIKSGKTAYGSGTGFFLGHSGTTPVFDIGSTTNYLRWTGSAISLIGDISGASNIDITGSAKFQGTVSVDGYAAAVAANTAGGARNGVIAYSTTSPGAGQIAGGIVGVAKGSGSPPTGGVVGFAYQGSANVGVYGEQGGSSTGGIGVAGAATSVGTGVQAWNASTTGIGLELLQGKFKWGSYSWVMPTGSTTTYLRNDGTWAAPPGTGVTSVGASSSAGGLSLSSSGGTTPTITLSGTPTSSTQISATGHTYTFSGGLGSGAATATFSSTTKPGANSSNLWASFVIDGTTYYIPVWT